MIDVNKPVTNPDLVNAMNKYLSEKNEENEINLIGKISQANFLTPIIFNGKIENGILKQDSTISFKLISNNLNDSFFIAFTDWEELGKWSKEKEQTLIVTYDDLKSIVLKDNNKETGFVINPFGQNILITPQLMQYFSQKKSGVSEITIQKETKVLMGQPANYPHDLENALAHFLKKHKEVESAYLFLAHMENNQKPNLLLVIDFTGEKSILFPQIAKVATTYLGKDEYIDLIPMKSDFGTNAIKHSSPFYKKKTWKLFG